jgi:hypothetical protein
MGATAPVGSVGTKSRRQGYRIGLKCSVRICLLVVIVLGMVLLNKITPPGCYSGRTPFR